MNRTQLAHIVRAAAKIAVDGDMVIIGSQSILGSYEDTDLPEAATLSVEADVAFRDDPGAEKADKVEGAIGEGSPFHSSFGYYAQGVELETARLPGGWEARLVLLDRADSEPGDAQCLEPHDLVVAKLVAGREKDIGFAVELIVAGIVTVDTLRDRSAALDAPIDRQRVDERITACAARADAAASPS